MIRALLVCMAYLLILLLPNGARAGDCQKTGTACADTTPCKQFNGLWVCLAGVSPPAGGVNVTESCWQYTDTYKCLKENALNYCQAISQISGCYQTNSVCSEKDHTGACMYYTNTYRCGSDVGPVQGVIKLDGSYTITTDTVDRAQCASYASNPSCTLASHVCTDPGGTRNINGLQVYKDCWGWTDSYTCITQNYQNYCLPLRQTPGCTEVSNVCKSTAWDGSCSEYDRTFRCDGKQGEPLPPNTTFLNTEYTITKDRLDTAQCDPNKNNPNCILASHTCTQPGGTRNINGLAVYKDCWEWTDSYVCASTQLKSDCDSLRNNAACTEKGATCLDALPSGQCGLLERKFQCRIKDANSKTITTCDNGVCVGGNCSAPSTNPDTDFGKVIAALEAQRQMGQYYDPETGQLFKGVSASCSKKLGGAVNCCNATGGGGGKSNAAMMHGTKIVGSEAVNFLGSSYVYDALFSTDLIPTTILNRLYSPDTILQSSSYGFSGDTTYQIGQGGNISFYGITYVPTNAPPFAFDLTSFAIAIAIQVASQYLQCDPPEQLLGMRKDQQLCTRVDDGSWCHKKVFNSCVTKKESYCCYNSKLSRIINEQGRKQIGKGYGDQKNPDCSGFTFAEIDKLDFGQMDLNEFIRDIAPKDLDTNLFNKRSQDTIQKKSSDYFNSGAYKQ